MGEFSLLIRIQNQKVPRFRNTFSQEEVNRYRRVRAEVKQAGKKIKDGESTSLTLIREIYKFLRQYNIATSFVFPEYIQHLPTEDINVYMISVPMKEEDDDDEEHLFTLTLTVFEDGHTDIHSEQLLKLLEGQLQEKNRELGEYKQKQAILEKQGQERILHEYSDPITVIVEITAQGYRIHGKGQYLDRISGEGETEEEALLWFHRDFVGHLARCDYHKNEKNFTDYDRKMYEMLQLLYVDTKHEEPVEEVKIH